MSGAMGFMTRILPRLLDLADGATRAGWTAYRQRAIAVARGRRP